jgi:hypothetical protein
MASFENTGAIHMAAKDVSMHALAALLRCGSVADE